jgi:hypothetical protein
MVALRRKTWHRTYVEDCGSAHVAFSGGDAGKRKRTRGGGVGFYGSMIGERRLRSSRYLENYSNQLVGIALIEQKIQDASRHGYSGDLDLSVRNLSAFDRIKTLFDARS